MKKKIMAIAAGVLACALIAAGCGRSGEVVSYDAQEEEVTTITFFGYKYEPENVKVIEEIISSFMKRNPDIRVSYEPEGKWLLRCPCKAHGFRER